MKPGISGRDGRDVPDEPLPPDQTGPIRRDGVLSALPAGVPRGPRGTRPPLAPPSDSFSAADSDNFGAADDADYSPYSGWSTPLGTDLAGGLSTPVPAPTFIDTITGPLSRSKALGSSTSSPRRTAKTHTAKSRSAAGTSGRGTSGKNLSGKGRVAADGTRKGQPARDRPTGTDPTGTDPTAARPRVVQPFGPTTDNFARPAAPGARPPFEPPRAAPP
ncbi:MAG: hypothetical protein ACQSGP_27395, partial [Frankia sp.]